MGGRKKIDAPHSFSRSPMFSKRSKRKIKQRLCTCRLLVHANTCHTGCPDPELYVERSKSLWWQLKLGNPVVKQATDGDSVNARNFHAVLLRK